MEQNMNSISMRAITRATQLANSGGDGPLPEGYSVLGKKIVEIESGFKAIVLENTATGHRIYAVASTEFSENGKLNLKDVKSDVDNGIPQAGGDAADRLAEHAAKFVRGGGNATFTGHSQGDTVSKVLAYLAERSVRRSEKNRRTKGREKPNRGNIFADAGISGWGAEELIRRVLYTRHGNEAYDRTISAATKPVTSHFPGDLIVARGTPTGELRVLPNDRIRRTTITTGEPPDFPSRREVEDSLLPHTHDNFRRQFDPGVTYPEIDTGSSGSMSKLSPKQEKEQKAIKRFRSTFLKPVSEVEEALNKDPRGWTADEAALVKRFYLDTHGGPDTRAIDGLRERHRAHNTPDDLYPSTYDQRVAKTPSPAVAARGGMDLTRAMAYLGADFGRQAETHGLAPVVRWLQRGLDFIEPSDDGPDGQPLLSFTGGGLKKDGIPGPKTIAATRRAVVALGNGRSLTKRETVDRCEKAYDAKAKSHSKHPERHGAIVRYRERGEELLQHQPATISIQRDYSGQDNERTQPTDPTRGIVEYQLPWVSGHHGDHDRPDDDEGRNDHHELQRKYESANGEYSSPGHTAYQRVEGKKEKRYKPTNKQFQTERTATVKFFRCPISLQSTKRTQASDEDTNGTGNQYHRADGTDAQFSPRIEISLNREFPEIYTT